MRMFQSVYGLKIALALCVNAVDFCKRYPFGTYAPPNNSFCPFYRLLLLALEVGRKPKNLLWNSAKLMNTLKHNYVFYYDLYDQSDEFNVIGQQVSYCPARVKHAIHCTGAT